MTEVGALHIIIDELSKQVHFDVNDKANHNLPHKRIVPLSGKGVFMDSYKTTIYIE